MISSISHIGWLGLSASVLGVGVSIAGQRKAAACAGSENKESASTGVPEDSSLLTSNILLWAIGIILAIGACVALSVLVASDDAIRGRVSLVNEDRTIKAMGPFGIWFIRATALISFLALSACALLRVRYELAKGLLRRLLEDRRAFFAKIIGGAREWVTEGHNIPVVCLGIVLLIAVAIRLFFLAQPMGYDEAITVVRFSSRPLLDVVSDYSIPNNHVFHTVLVHCSSALFGNVPAVVRLPAFLAGTMIVPASFWLMRRLFDDYTGLLTAGLTAVAPAMVEYSVQARGYTILTLFFLIAFVMATYLKEESSLTGWAIFIVTFTLGFHTIPTMLYPFGVVSLWLLWAASKQRRKTLLRELTFASLAIAVGTLLLYLPVILRSGYRRLFANEELTRLSFGPLLKRNASNWLFTVQCWTGSLYFPIIILIALSVVVAIVFSWRNNRQASFVLPAILLWMIPVILIQRVAPFPRVFNFLFPIFGGLAAYGASISFKKLPIHSNRMAQYLWAAVVIVVSGYWGISRVLIPCVPFPGAEGINRCAEGFFVDAEPIINDLKPILHDRDALVAHAYSGIVESTQFYLIRANRQPTLVHAYNPAKGLQQLDKYDQLFIAARRSVPQSQGNETDLLKALNCSQEDFDSVFERPELAARYQISDLYRLHKKARDYQAGNTSLSGSS